MACTAAVSTKTTRHFDAALENWRAVCVLANHMRKRCAPARRLGTVLWSSHKSSYRPGESQMQQHSGVPGADAARTTRADGY